MWRIVRARARSTSPAWIASFSAATRWRSSPSRPSIARREATGTRPLKLRSSARRWGPPAATLMIRRNSREALSNRDRVARLAGPLGGDGELGEDVGRALARQARRGQGVEQRVELERLADRRRVEAGDEGAAVEGHLDDPVAPQHQQRLAHRRPADAELGRHRVEVDPVAGAELARDEHLEDPLGDHVAGVDADEAAPGGAARGVGLGRWHRHATSTVARGCSSPIG